MPDFTWQPKDHICPHCGADAVEFDDFDTYNEAELSFSQDAHCAVCGVAWVDKYVYQKSIRGRKND